jgi:hypothetical protein
MMDQEFFRDMEALAQTHVQIVLPGEQAFALLATLQLALRHPGFVARGGPTYQIAMSIAEALERDLATTPRLKMAVAAGWHSKFDVPAAGPSVKPDVQPGEGC